MLILIYLVSLLCSVRAAIFYDSYYGTEITREEVRRHDKANTTFWCVNEVEPCDPHEGRRVDGSCNNLHHPPRGATHTPFARVLPPVYSKNFEPKKTASGNEMPLARYLRTRLYSEGRVPSQIFTTLAIHFFTFMSADVVSFHDTTKLTKPTTETHEDQLDITFPVNYIVWRPYCCAEKGRKDYMCVPNKIPDDDPVHRFSGVRCVNMTRPVTFQIIGCIKNDTAPERIASSTPLMDLSVIYGSQLASLNQRGRIFKGGMVKTELDDKGRIWPPSTNTTANVCFLNQKPQETRCHAMPDDSGNTLASINLVVVWFWRNHNFIAKNLASVNPCWDDDKLFNVTRDINIAISLQLYYYELLPLYMGFDNMVKDGVITPFGGFRDDYNPHLYPQVSLEYPFVLRWVHTIQDGPLKLYDKDGYYLKQVPLVNLTFRTGYFGVDDNMDYLTQGSFRQGSAREDYIADPDITEMGLGPLQHVSDLMTNDLAKNRYFGFQPYIKYREFCFGKPIHSFEDLHGFIDPERIEILREVYEKVEDIDLLAGIWVEKSIPGGFVPQTFYCLVIEQLKRNTASDRHWYERPHRPNAFTFEQLAEIRKYTIARLLCDVGDTVERIQPQAFLKAGYYNRMRSCDQIIKIDYSAWKDARCYPQNPWTTYV